jgi:hypothetical protein
LSFKWLSSLAGSEERILTSRTAGGLILQAAQTSSLDGALIGKNVNQTLSHFLVLEPSGEKDVQ